VQCSYYDSWRCRSCALLDRSYEAQLDAKVLRARDLVGRSPGLEWLPPVRSADKGFRNKAKMVVAGTLERPTLGILDAHSHGVDLRHCPLYPTVLHESFAALAEFITLARVAPYDVARRSGELKYVLTTASPDGEVMVRFVLRSQEAVGRIRKHLPWLQAGVRGLTVVSVNLQPEHKAVLEGEREILLTEQESLAMRLDGVTMHLRPQSFFQTNSQVAAALYRQVRDWVAAIEPRSLWDLYCGVGGFALHCAASGREVVGVETSAEAVAGARASAREAELDGVRFEVGDSTAFAIDAREAPALVVVNPPRRGIGPDLADWLEASTVGHVVYSSCSAESLARDLERMPSLRPRRARLLDMFPHTWHGEVVMLLERG
jgi:23S rRNA (uracil747-C5)-methyltransferase